MNSLKVERLRLNLTQIDLAELLGASPSTLSKLETGKVGLDALKISQIMRLADLFGVTVDELISNLLNRG